MSGSPVSCTHCPQCQRPFFCEEQECEECGWRSEKYWEADKTLQLKLRQRRGLRLRAMMAIAVVGLGSVLLFIGISRPDRDLMAIGRAIGVGGFLLYALTRWRMWRLGK